MHRHKTILYVTILFAVAGLLSLTTGTNSAPSLVTTNATAAGTLALPQMEGTWSGTWTDTLYNVSGAVDLVIWAEGADYVATGSIDVSAIGSSLGTLAGGAIGTYTGSTLDINFNCTSLGNGNVVLTPVPAKGTAVVATASGTGNVTAPLSFGPFTLTGNASDTDITGSFDFTSPGGGKGICQITKTSVSAEPVAWGTAKAAYRAP